MQVPRDALKELQRVFDMKHVPRLYLLGRLTEEDEIAFEEHLMECAVCRHEVMTTAMSLQTFRAFLWIPYSSRMLPPPSRMPLN